MRKYSTIMLILLSFVLVAWGQRADNGELKRIKMEVRRLPDLNIARAGHTIFLAGNELTVVGGHTSGFVLTPTAEYYSGGAWHLLNTVYPHDNGMAVVLDGGDRVLLAGGHEKNLGIGQRYEAEMYYPSTHTFNGFSCLDRKRAFSQGTELDSNQVLIVGNHQGNDAFELYDGNRTFRHIKDVAVWHPSPYIFPVVGGEVMAFGATWSPKCTSYTKCDTVDRLRGEPFRVPLLAEWMPFVYDQNSHTRESFIGKTAEGNYRYLIAATNDSGNVAYIHIQDTQFSILPTACPIPILLAKGDIRHISPSIADTHARRAYIVYCDTSNRVYVLAAEYDKSPAPLTLYYTDPLPEFGDCTPVLTADGNIMMAGGIIDNNFSPQASVWLLPVAGDDRILQSLMPTESQKAKTWWLWLLIGVAIVGGGLLTVKRKKKNDSQTQSAVAPSDSQTQNATTTSDNDLMERIIELMESEKLYLKPDLQLSHLADILEVHSNTVSACINTTQGCNFSQWVNEYRLQHAKKLLSENPNMKISAVGLESGFANERSFFRSFKAATGMTPGEWVKKVEN